MKALRNLVFGLILGLALGLWFGFNIAKDRPLLSNPFAEPGVEEKVKRAGEEILRKGGEALEKGGKTLQEKATD